MKACYLMTQDVRWLCNRTENYNQETKAMKLATSYATRIISLLLAITSFDKFMRSNRISTFTCKFD